MRMCYYPSLMVLGIFVGLAGPSPAALAQAPETDAGPTRTAAHSHLQDDGVQPPVPDPPGTDEDDEPPLIPETVVPARPDAFPATPLGEETLLTPSSVETPISETGSAITVITSEELRRSGQVFAAEALRTVTGVDVARQGGIGGLTSVFIRGANGQQTKVLLDGMPINDPASAARAFDFSLLTVDDVERIEVLRGPQSVLFGSDAIGGVVNITTKRGDGPLQIRFSGTGGSYGTSRESIQASAGNDRAYFSFGGSFWDASGFSAAARENGNREADGYQNGTGSLRVGWTPSPWFNVDYVARYTDVRSDVDDFDFTTGLPIDNLIRANLTQGFFHRVQFDSGDGDGLVRQRLSLSQSDYRRQDTDPGQFVPPVFEGQSRQIQWQASLLLTEQNTLTTGVVYYHEEALNSFQPQVSQNQKSLFVEDQFQLADAWYASIGFRWDDHSVAGTAQTYRFTNRIPVAATASAIHGSIGTGFRAPSLAENLFQFGNPNLLPERSKGWDVGWEQQLADGRLLLDATYFRNDLTDLILFDFATFSLANIGRARTSGVECTATWQAGGPWILAATYTYTDTEDLDSGTQLVRRPRNKASLIVDRLIGCDRGVLRGQLLYVGRRIDTGGVILDEYFLLNGSARYALNNLWTAVARLDNVLDQNYQEVNGYGVAGFSGYAGLELLW